nr:cobalamin biosynthesis protein [Roseomonas acroporae]
MVRRAEAVSGRRVTRLAAPEFRRDAAALAEAAAALGLPLAWVGREALLAVQPRCVTRSAAAARHTGIASVAEGCALAAAGEGARLLVARVDGDKASCALATH